MAIATGCRSVAVASALAVMTVGSSSADPSEAHRSATTLIIQLDDARQIRIRGGRLVSLAGADVRKLERTLSTHGRGEIAPLFGRGEEVIEQRRRRAEARSGRRLPDLNSYYQVTLDTPITTDLLERLRALDIVRAAYRAPLPAPPPVDIPPTTPDGESAQIYLDPAPEGIDARAAWTRPGGRGEGVFLVDIEYDWRDTHEDLESALGRYECFTPTGTQEIEHGTAVIGEIVGGDNGYGVTGIANQVEIGLVTHWPVGMTYSVARSVECASALMDPGDVLLVEAQTVGPRGLFVPPEWDQAEFDAISIAAASGIVVVETAGNGGEDLDDAAFGGAFDRTVRDSGALIVGAGADLYYPPDQPDLSRLDFSTYGSRVDLQGWGDDVVTTGYGDAFDGGGDPNQYYTAVFDGTSSAAPMVAGAAAILQGVQMACGGEPLTPAHVHDILVATGSPQVTGPYPGHIGPRPDLQAALALVDVDDDTDGWAECEGDCDDATAATYPGAAESNDGLDNQCPGDQGYGSIDETSGVSGFQAAASTAEYSWAPQAGATGYEVARSTSADFSSGCMSWVTAGTAVLDAEIPQTSEVFFYLNRPLTPFAGSWGQRSSGAERSGSCL